MKRVLTVLVVLSLAGCSSGGGGGGGGGPHFEQRTPTAADTPFGGGFPPNQHPDGDAFGAQQRRQELRLVWPDGPAGGQTADSSRGAGAPGR